MREEYKNLLKSSNRLTLSQKIFFVEFVGTFVIVVFAAGSVMIDSKSGGAFGLLFVAAAPLAAVAGMIYAFGKVSMAHFNPAVSIAFLVSGHLKRPLLPVYLGAEILGAILAALFLFVFIGSEANIGANAPNYSFPLPVIFGVEVLTTFLLMTIVFAVVYTKGMKGWGGLVIGCTVGLDIFVFAFISGASMNPARSFGPALVSGALLDLWLYWSAPFVGTIIAALLWRNKFRR